MANTCKISWLKHFQITNITTSDGLCPRIHSPESLEWSGHTSWAIWPMSDHSICPCVSERLSIHWASCQYGSIFWPSSALDMLKFGQKKGKRQDPASSWQDDGTVRRAWYSSTGSSRGLNSIRAIGASLTEVLHSKKSLNDFQRIQHDKTVTGLV